MKKRKKKAVDCEKEKVHPIRTGSSLIFVAPSPVCSMKDISGTFGRFFCHEGEANTQNILRAMLLKGNQNKKAFDHTSTLTEGIKCFLWPALVFSL